MKGKKIFSLFILPITLTLVVCVTLLYSCARLGTPDGGLYDETPPKILRTSPRNGDMNVTPKKIVLEFDEIVKLENSQSVVVSPPQIEQPTVEAYGRKVTVELVDSLKPNMTYTIDFGNSISDNNEGNPFGDYAFTFSTGEKIDTFQVSGYVLDASNLEPIKDILVGLYTVDLDSVFDDSIFYKKPFERISHTDGSGHFVIKGLDKAATYKIFALKDQDQDYKFSQKTEMIAFTPQTFSSSCKLDIRPDTVWHDSIHYDSINFIPYTHFYPDDIALLAFTEDGQNRQFLKQERLDPKKFSLFFTAPHDSLPIIRGIDFDATDAFVIDASEGKDSIDYWIKDSVVYNRDTLHIQFDYYMTDSMGNLTLTTSDTIKLLSKLTRAKILKDLEQKREEWVKEYKKEHREEIREKKRELKDQGIKVKDEDSLIYIPPMPEECMEMKFSVSTSIDPDKNIDITFPEPIDSIDYAKIHFKTKQDTVFLPTRFLLKKCDGELLKYRFFAEWQPDSTYELSADTGAFVSIYGTRSTSFKRSIKVKSLDSYSTLNLNMKSADPSAIVQLLDASDKVIKTAKLENGMAYFYFINPGTYYVRAFYDTNGNGKWDTGNYATGTQAEKMFYMPKELPLKAAWSIDENWNPSAKDITKQKPSKITKQKPDKEKTIKSRNAEKLAERAKRQRNGK
ncbi:MAG: Ig-like domain-containing protein [Bacteroidaceae bacterium]|nr:Ig-like domain-containing protein [Bacteroidaceae bacterium]